MAPVGNKMKVDFTIYVILNKSKGQNKTTMAVGFCGSGFPIRNKPSKTLAGP